MLRDARREGESWTTFDFFTTSDFVLRVENDWNVNYWIIYFIQEMKDARSDVIYFFLKV